MGGKAKPAKPAKAASQASAEDPPAAEPERIKNLYDAGALKGTLDSAARDVVLDAGYEEDVNVINIKIALGFLAIGVALYAQFGPGKFPATWWTVFGCVAAYVVLSIAMNIYSWKVEGDSFLLTKPFKGSKGVRLTSILSRNGDEYVLTIADRYDPSIEVEVTYPVHSYFHSDGYLAEAAWKAEVEKQSASFHQSYDAATKKD